MIDSNEVNPEDTDETCRQIQLIKKFIRSDGEESGLLQVFKNMVEKNSKLRMNFIFLLQFFRINGKFELTIEQFKPIYKLINIFMEAVIFVLFSATTTETVLSWNSSWFCWRPTSSHCRTLNYKKSSLTRKCKLTTRLSKTKAFRPSSPFNSAKSKRKRKSPAVFLLPSRLNKKFISCSSSRSMSFGMIWSFGKVSS